MKTWKQVQDRYDHLTTELQH